MVEKFLGKMGRSFGVGLQGEDDTSQESADHKAEQAGVKGDSADGDAEFEIDPDGMEVAGDHKVRQAVIRIEQTQPDHGDGGVNKLLFKNPGLLCRAFAQGFIPFGGISARAEIPGDECFGMTGLMMGQLEICVGFRTGDGGPVEALQGGVFAPADVGAAEPSYRSSKSPSIPTFDDDSFSGVALSPGDNNIGSAFAENLQSRGGFATDGQCELLVIERVQTVSSFLALIKSQA